MVLQLPMVTVLPWLCWAVCAVVGFRKLKGSSLSYCVQRMAVIAMIVRELRWRDLGLAMFVCVCVCVCARSFRFKDCCLVSKQELALKYQLFSSDS